jgi:hypothetical protein
VPNGEPRGLRAGSVVDGDCDRVPGLRAATHESLLLVQAPARNRGQNEPMSLGSIPTRPARRHGESDIINESGQPT